MITEETACTTIGVRVLRSVGEIEEIRSVWTAWNRHPNSDLDFYLLLMQLKPEIMRPHIIMAYRDGKPEAMLIGRILQQRLEFKIGYKAILRPKVRLLNIVVGGTLGNLSSGSAQKLVHAVINCLRQGEADAAVFNHIRADGPLYEAARREPGFLSRDFFPDVRLHRSVSLPGTPETFYSGLSRKVRKNQKWQAKRLLRKFGPEVEIHCFRRADELERAFCDLEEIAKKTYQRGLGAGFVDNDEMRRRLLIDAQQDRLRAFVLYLEEKPCAFWVGSIYQKTFHSGYMGYDTAYSEYSPGMFLVVRVIEDICDHKDGEVIQDIDFGLGDAQYKEMLCNRAWQDGTVFLFGPTPKGIWLNAIRTSVSLLDRFAKNLLSRTGSLQRIKTAWRRYRRPKDASSRQPAGDQHRGLMDSNDG